MCVCGCRYTALALGVVCCWLCMRNNCIGIYPAAKTVSIVQLIFVYVFVRKLKAE